MPALCIEQEQQVLILVFKDGTRHTDLLEAHTLAMK
jgi:hypothetical protein